MNHSTENLQPHPIEGTERIEEIALTSNEKLVEAGAKSANRAFNVGCTVGLLPAIIIIITTLIISKGSWIATAFISILMGMGLVAFANLSAYISRSKAYQRIFEQDLKPEIETQLDDLEIEYRDFVRVADEVLDSDAPMRAYIFPEPKNENSNETLEL